MDIDYFGVMPGFAIPKNVARVRIGRVTLRASDKPPGWASDIYPRENGVFVRGSMALCEVTANQSPVFDTVTYERVA